MIVHGMYYTCGAWFINISYVEYVNLLVNKFTRIKGSLLNHETDM